MQLRNSKLGFTYFSLLDVMRNVHQSTRQDRLRALARELDKCRNAGAGAAQSPQLPSHSDETRRETR
jgi:hypothetical protein